MLHAVGGQVCGEYGRSGFGNSDRFVLDRWWGGRLLGRRWGFGRFRYVGNQGLLRS